MTPLATGAAYDAECGRAAAEAGVEFAVRGKPLIAIEHPARGIEDDTIRQSDGAEIILTPARSDVRAKSD